MARRGAADLPLDDAIIAMTAFYGTFLDDYIKPADSLFFSMQPTERVYALRNARAVLTHFKHCLDRDHPGAVIGEDLRVHIAELGGVIRRRDAFERLRHDG